MHVVMRGLLDKSWRRGCLAMEPRRLVAVSFETFHRGYVRVVVVHGASAVATRPRVIPRQRRGLPKDASVMQLFEFSDAIEVA